MTKPMADAKPSSEGKTVKVDTLSAGQAADLEVYGKATDHQTGLDVKPIK